MFSLVSIYYVVNVFFSINILCCVFVSMFTDVNTQGEQGTTITNNILCPDIAGER